MEDGTYEPIETAFVEQRLLTVDALVNVGANYGYYACLGRKLGRQVIAFEPHPSNFAVLLRNLEINNWLDVEAYPLAISKDPGISRFYGSGTGASLIAGWAGTQTSHYRLVPSTRLDYMLVERITNKRVLFLIDVEGAEYQVLSGAVGLLDLDPSPIWFIEISVSSHQPRGVAANPNLLEIFTLFWSRGYRAYRLDETLVPVTESDVRSWVKNPPIDFSSNFVFQRSAEADH